MHYFRSDTEPLKIKEIAEKNNQKAICIQADLTLETGVIDCVKAAAGYLESYDILVNNSGSLVERRYLADVDTEYWNRVMDINLTTMMLVTRELLPYMNSREGASNTHH